MSVNRVTLIGNVGKDPEVRSMNNGDNVVTLNVATSHRKKQGDEWVDDTQWHRVVLYKRLAEIAGERITKGSTIYVEGRIQYRTYEKDGAKQSVTEIIGIDMQVLAGKAAKKEQVDEDVPF